jgi:hypothetical protein
MDICLNKIIHGAENYNKQVFWFAPYYPETDF